MLKYTLPVMKRRRSISLDNSYTNIYADRIKLYSRTHCPQKEIAFAAGISPKTVSAIVNGRRRVTKPLAAKFDMIFDQLDLNAMIGKQLF